MTARNKTQIRPCSCHPNHTHKLKQEEYGLKETQHVLSSLLQDTAASTGSISPLPVFPQWHVPQHHHYWCQRWRVIFRLLDRGPFHQLLNTRHIWRVIVLPWRHVQCHLYGHPAQIRRRPARCTGCPVSAIIRHNVSTLTTFKARPLHLGAHSHHSAQRYG